MARKITANLGPQELTLHIPIKLITQLLKPRVIYADGARFTNREKQVLDGVVRGLVNKEIASKLNVSERTVKFHVSKLYDKTKVRSRFELQALYASENGERK